MEFNSVFKGLSYNDAISGVVEGRSRTAVLFGIVRREEKMNISHTRNWISALNEFQQMTYPYPANVENMVSF